MMTMGGSGTTQFHAVRSLYIVICLLCKVTLIVGGEKIKDKGGHGIMERAAGAGPGRRTPTGNPAPDPAICDNEILNKCLAKIPPLPDLGIPSTNQGVANACMTFNSGMDCAYNWATKCIGTEGMHKLNNSILGAHEMFTFLCRDPAFRQDFLQHSACYRRISRQWDECAKNFILAIQSLNNHETSKDLCCVRILFLQCLMDVTHRFCEKDAAKFIQLMGETLIRSTLRGHAPKHCHGISHSDCAMYMQSSVGFFGVETYYNGNGLIRISSSIAVITFGHTWCNSHSY